MAARLIAGRRTIRRLDKIIHSDFGRREPDPAPRKGAGILKMSRVDRDVFRIQIQGSDSVTPDTKSRGKSVEVGREGG